MKVEMPVPCLRMYEDWYPECDKLLEGVIGAADREYSICPWMRSKIAAQTGNVDAFDYRSSVQCSLQDILVSSDPDFAEVRRSVEHFTLRIDEMIRDYNETYETGIKQSEGFHVLRYQNKAEYRNHHDHGVMNQRTLSLVMFLNDDYEGGELEFPYFDYKIVPQKGKVVLFPSSFAYSHIAHPVEEGTKYTAINWYK